MARQAHNGSERWLLRQMREETEGNVPKDWGWGEKHTANSRQKPTPNLPLKSGTGSPKRGIHQVPTMYSPIEEDLASLGPFPLATLGREGTHTRLVLPVRFSSCHNYFRGIRAPKV